MYKPADKTQTFFLDFNQPAGLHLNPNNRWVQMEDKVPWKYLKQSTPVCFPVAQAKCCKAVAYGTRFPDYLGPIPAF